MDTVQAFSPSLLAVVLSAISSFIIGGLWYSPALFGKAWMAASGMTEEKIKEGNMGKTYGLAWFFTLIISVNFGIFFNDPTINGSNGALYGFFTGFGFMMMAVAINALFEQRSAKYILINGGYWVVLSTLIGFIIGVWR